MTAAAEESSARQAASASRCTKTMELRVRSHDHTRAKLLVRWLVVGLLTGGPAVVYAQTGRIAGRVTAAGRGAVSGTQVIVVGTPLSTMTDGQGEFLLQNVPAGDRTVRAIRIGYEPFTTNVTVVAGQTAPANLSLLPEAQDQTIASSYVPVDTLPADSIRLPVPDSAIISRRQAVGLSFTLRAGDRGRLVVSDGDTLVLQAQAVERTARGVNANGIVVGSDGSAIGTFVVVERDLHLMANVRPGLRLIQVRSQARGIALIVVVDLQKMPGPGGGDR